MILFLIFRLEIITIGGILIHKILKIEESISLTDENIKYLLSHLMRIKLLGQEFYYLKRWMWWN